MENIFLNNDYCKVIDGKLAYIYRNAINEIPIIKKQKISINNIKYIGFQNIKYNDKRMPQEKTVGFFLNDYRFKCICDRPWNYIVRLKQYKQVMTPDNSCYLDMPRYLQYENIVKNRIIGKYLQSEGLTVIPTVTWGDEPTFDFCFKGIEKGSSVSISTIGTKKNYPYFIAGFKEMCKQLNPENVICYCTPYPEMFRYSNIIAIDYEGQQAIRNKQKLLRSGQLSLNLWEV